MCWVNHVSCQNKIEIDLISPNLFFKLVFFVATRLSLYWERLFQIILAIYNDFGILCLTISLFSSENLCNPKLSQSQDLKIHDHAQIGSGGYGDSCQLLIEAPGCLLKQFIYRARVWFSPYFPKHLQCKSFSLELWTKAFCRIPVILWILSVNRIFSKVRSLFDTRPVENRMGWSQSI